MALGRRLSLDKLWLSICGLLGRDDEKGLPLNDCNSLENVTMEISHWYDSVSIGMKKNRKMS